jgi:hypothetical protein
LSVQKKAFLLRGVNKENNGGCQGYAKELEQQMGAANNGMRTGERKKKRVWEAKGEQLTRKQQPIQSFFVH